MFKIDKEKINRIAKEFDTNGELVATLAEHYRTIQNGMKEQYLAHIIRTMETQLQELTNNPMFKIKITNGTTSYRFTIMDHQLDR